MKKVIKYISRIALGFFTLLGRNGVRHLCALSNPKRMLQDVNKGKVNTSLLALSCFT